MSNVVSLHELFYKLLIVKGYNCFTVTELRDALLTMTGDVFCSNKARMYVYRRILYMESKQLLRKTQSGPGKQVRYLTTPLFKSTIFRPKSTLKDHNLKVVEAVDTSFHNALRKEKQACEDSLKITKQEMAAFASLIQRYPEQQDNVRPFFYQAREEVYRLQSQVSAISKILEIA
ncbi:hypothetical protein [Motilimonas cestriensis]|uniref:Response regulator n=1 Tax=Motilimonas cestriensis TaxID=2742685 RepID=A0ABS8WCK0_9GAMM|nr:hypothetical protein [Motilimonas cestriensis]MCE2595857.1 hypothetical protein [Motilimonas cestriensis]